MSIIHKKLRMINEISKDWTSKFPKVGDSKTGGRTSPLVSGAVVVKKTDGRTLCSPSGKVFELYDGVTYGNHRANHIVMSQTNMPETRQRMRPWLEARINSGNIRGLEWINKEQKIFKVTWKQVGSRDWSEHDGIIFKEWAVHTGRYRDGVDQPDWPTWKTRFRCALNKLPYINELKEYNKLDGQTGEPYRVYQFVPRSVDTSNHEMRPGRIEIHDDNSNGCPTQPMIPVTVTSSNSMLSENMMSLGENRLPSDIRDVDPMHFESGCLEHVPLDDLRGSLSSIEMKSAEDQEDCIRQKAGKPYPSTQGANNWTLDLSDCKLSITIKYQRVTVTEFLCTNRDGCHIYFDRQVQLSNPEEHEQMYGPRNAQQISLPLCNIQNGHQQRLTTDLLHAMDRGIVLRVIDGNIYATRKCRCRIYIAKPSLENRSEIIKLPRNQETLVFDLKGYFQPALERYLHQRGPKPNVEVIVGFGQNFTIDRESINSLLVSATVVHTEAHNLLTKILCTSPTSPNISMSRSDNMDRLMDVLQFTHIQNDVPPVYNRL